MITAGLLWAFTFLPIGHGNEAPVDQKISVEIEAAPASRLLPELGKSFGIRLRADKTTQDDVLVVSVANVSIPDLLKRIARLDGAEWHKASDGAYELVRPLELRLKQEEIDRNAMIESIRKRQEALSRSLLAAKELTVSEAKAVLAELSQKSSLEKNDSLEDEIHRQKTLAPIIAQFPLQRLADRILIKLDPAVLASLPIGQVTVFSDHPNRMQTQLPLNLNGLFAQFLREHQTFFKATGSFVDPNHPDRPSYNEIGKLLFQSPPLKTIVSIRRQGVQGFVVQVSLLKNDHDLDRSQLVFLPRETPTKASEPRESQLLYDSLPTRSRKFLKEIIRNGGSNNFENVISTNRDVKAWYLEPVENEPLAFLSGGMLLAIAHERQKNVVAVLSDQVEGLLDWVTKETQPSVLDAERMLYEGADFKVDVSEDWIEVQPRLPSINRRSRLDRRTLKALFKGTDNDCISLSLMSQAARLLPRDDFGVPHLMWYFSRQGSELSLQLLMYHESLRFYGTLSPVQIRSLINGNRLRVDQLSKDQYRALVEIISSGLVKLDYVEPKNNPHASRPARFDTNIASEILPNGPSLNGTITMSRDESIEIVAYTNGPPWEGSLQPGHIGDQLYWADHPNPNGELYLKPTHYRLVKTYEVSLTLSLATDVEANLMFLDSQPASPDRLLTYDELPKSIRDAAEKEYNEMLRRDEKSKQSDSR